MERFRFLQPGEPVMKKDTKKRIRAAIYTRVSTEEGLDQEFNSLDAQRDACMAFIKSQEGQGWIAIEPSYDDGGFTGANLKRPALSALMKQIELGSIDCVVTYKVDRLSRSLLDFVKLMEVFDKHDVAYVSVTQQINSSTSMGRLLFNLLLSFAEFEREQIAERTRDKMRAAKRRGKWIGGWPPLGYDLDLKEKRLVINSAEASTVREIFRLYLDQGSLTATLHILNEEGIHSKRWLTKTGKPFGGRPFLKNTLTRLLNNIIYCGKVTLDGECFDGEHEAIIEQSLFDKTRKALTSNRRNTSSSKYSKHSPMLRGLLYCAACDRTMIHATTKKGENRIYRYYVCGHAMKNGWDKCRSPSIPAQQVEIFVLNQIQSMGKDRGLVKHTHTTLIKLASDRRTIAQERLDGLQKSIAQFQTQLGETQLRESKEFHQSQIQNYESEVKSIESEIKTLKSLKLSEKKIAGLLSEFTPVWEATSPINRVRLMKQVIDRIDFAGSDQKLHIHLNPSGIQTLIHNEKK